MIEMAEKVTQPNDPDYPGIMTPFGNDGALQGYSAAAVVPDWRWVAALVSSMTTIDNAQRIATHRKAVRGIPVSTNHPNNMGVIAAPKSIPE